MKLNSKTTKSKWHLITCQSILCLTFLSLPVPYAAGQTNPDALNFQTFAEALKAQDDVRALQIGADDFKKLEQKYQNDAGFVAFKSKLAAAEFLTRQMVDQLKKATRQQMMITFDDVFQSDEISKPPSLPPAKRFYETSVALFSTPISIDQLSEDEKNFMVQYYNLKLKNFTTSIARAGQALAVALPKFHDTHKYVLVLPLLHVAPEWMQKPEQLIISSNECLLHFGFPFQAMMLSQKAAEIKHNPFSEVDYYKSAAQKCGPALSNVAVACLQKAIACTSEKNIEAIIALKFDIVQLWWDSGNYSLAAGHAKQISQSYPHSNQYPKAVNLYYLALARDSNAEAVLVDIDAAINDRRCTALRARLMYYKWWALRRQRQQDARIAALEHDILQKFGHDPMVAPIMLSQATDHLARQDYLNAKQILARLVEKFPASTSALQANKILEKLKAIK